MIRTSMSIFTKAEARSFLSSKPTRVPFLNLVLCLLLIFREIESKADLTEAVSFEKSLASAEFEDVRRAYAIKQKAPVKESNEIPTTTMIYRGRNSTSFPPNSAA